VKRVQVLLALSTSLRTAFPDRADMLLTEIERWFPLDAKPVLGPTCALCGGGRGPHARCFIGARPESRFCVYGARPQLSDGPSLALCSTCIDRALDAEGTLPRVLADAVRALRSPDPDANEPAIRRLEEIHGRWTPATRAAPCAICAGSGTAIAPGDTVVCTACVATAHHILHTASAPDWVRLAREIDESDDLDGSMTAWDHLRALGEPSGEAVDAVARRIADILELIAGTASDDTEAAGNVVMDTATEAGSARVADALLRNHHPSDFSRRRLLDACMRIAEAIDLGTRFYRRTGELFEEITEEFDALARFAILRSEALWEASARGAVAIYGAPLACEAAARRIAHWGGQMIAIGTRGGTVRLHSVPDGSIVWIADWTLLMQADRDRLLATPGAWRIFIGARDRDELRRIDAMLFRRLIAEELRLPD
jgi:hypothetical protein